VFDPPAVVPSTKLAVRSVTYFLFTALELTAGILGLPRLSTSVTSSVNLPPLACMLPETAMLPEAF